MPRDYRAFLDDILEASRKALSYTAGLSEHQFRHDQKTVEAEERGRYGRGCTSNRSASQAIGRTSSRSSKEGPSSCAIR